MLLFRVMVMAVVVATAATATTTTTTTTVEEALHAALEQPSQWFVTTGFGALGICSAIFVSGIAEATAVREDGSLATELLTDVVVDYADASVTVNMKRDPANKYKAIFRGPTLGCTLVGGNVTEAEIRAQDTGLQTPIPSRNTSAPWPLGDGAPEPFPPEVDEACVRAAVDADFANPVFNTRSTVIVYNGQLIFERYAPTVTARSPLLGWSMSKSITSTLYGILARQGLVNISAAADVDEWDGDASKSDITYNHLLQMASGLRWEETIDLVVCLYIAVDCAQFYANRPVVTAPGTTFAYSTGETFLLARVLEEKLRGQRDINTFDWHREVLFRPMQMDNAVFEFTPQQYLAGGSLAYLTPRDWARYGLLYQRRGDWFGEQIIDPEWVDYSCTGAPTSPTRYGAQWWLGQQAVDADTCIASGFRNQNVHVMPNRNVVLVRHSMPQLLLASQWSESAWIESIMACFP